MTNELFWTLGYFQMTFSELPGLKLFSSNDLPIPWMTGPLTNLTFTTILSNQVKGKIFLCKEEYILKLLFLYKTVSFCGKGQITNEGNDAIKSGCFKQPNHDEGIDVEACFCDSGKKITNITIK